MNVDYNPYEGREVVGVTHTVLSRGRVVIDNGKFVGRAGCGEFHQKSVTLGAFTRSHVVM